MKRLALVLGLAVSGVAPAACGEGLAGRFLEVRNAAAVLHVIPEGRSDFAVNVEGGARLPKIAVRSEGDRVVVDGGLAGRIHGCHAGLFALWRPPGFFVFVAGIGDVPESQLPVITVRTPMDVLLGAGGAVKTDVGPSRSAGLAFSGCGDTEIRPVAGPLNLKLSGSGDALVEGARRAELTLAGSGDVRVTGGLPEGLKAQISGSGDVVAGSMGPVDLVLKGAGDVGLGSIAGPASITVMGSGDVGVSRIDGPLTVQVRGSGDVAVAGGSIPLIAVDVAGSGDVGIGAVVGGGSVSIAGSGDVAIHKATGQINTRKSGSGDIAIGS
jgi:hypothetical protein